MSKRTRITLRERLRRLRDRANAASRTPTPASHDNNQQPEQPSGVYPVVKPQRAWLTMRRSNSNAN